MKNEVYLDNSATTKPYDEVTEHISYISKNEYGNPSSLHKKGMEAERLIRTARETIADSLGVTSREIIFTSGGTESDNLAIRGYLEGNRRKGNHIITTTIEHPAVLEVFKHLSENGYRTDYLSVNSDGIINLEELKSKITGDTALISIIYANNEIGSIQPVEEVVRIKNSINPEAAVHVDAVQAYGKMRILPKRAGIDMMSISSHKIHGPKGAGALYVDKSVRMKPIIFGGGQESLLRSGTENVQGISGFGLAAKLTFEQMEKNWSRVSAVKELFIQKLNENIEDFKIVSSANSSPYILNTAFKNVKAEVLLHHLEERNIYVSTGSACSSRKNVHSHVLKAISLENCYIEGAIRFSLSGFNDEEDVSITIEALKDILPRIRYGGKR